MRNCTIKVAALAAVVAVSLGGVAMAAVVEPLLLSPFQSGDAINECAQAGVYQYAYKVDDWSAGLFGLYVAAFDDGHINNITISNNNGTTFDWTASPNPIGAVIVKGGPVANVFYYSPQAASDTGLFAPINPNNNQNYGISHVTFCWNPEVEIEYVYETAFAFGGDQDDCFLNNGFSRWGWSNGPIGPGSYTWPLYAGAAQCDLSKGILVGSVTVVYDGPSGNVTATFNVDGPFILDETHVYAGYGMFPLLRGKPTVAPGQYRIQGPFDGSPIFVIAHAVVGIPVAP